MGKRGVFLSAPQMEVEIIELHQLEYFVEVGKTRNFTKAAEHLCVAQSSVTKAIHNLEAELGVALFDRTRKPIALTEAGELFFPQVQYILSSLNEAVQEVSQQAGVRQAPINFGLPSWSGAKLKELLTSHRFVHDHKFLFNIIERSAPEVESRLLDGSMDIGWMINADLSPGIHFVPVEQQDVYCILKADSPLALKERLTFEELSGESFLISKEDRSSSLIRLVLERCRQAGYSPSPGFSSRQYLPNLQLFSQYILLGYGITFMPQYIALTITDPGLAVRPMDPPFLMEVGLAWNRKRQLSSYEKSFVKCVQSDYLAFIHLEAGL